MALSTVCMPLIITTTVSGETLFTWGIMSSPLIPGMVMSLITSSNWLFLKCSSACSAAPALRHSYSSLSKSDRISVISGSSSTISIRGVSEVSCNIDLVLSVTRVDKRYLRFGYNDWRVIVDWFFTLVLKKLARLRGGSNTYGEFLVGRSYLGYIASSGTFHVVGDIHHFDLILDLAFLFAGETIKQAKVMTEFVRNCISESLRIRKHRIDYDGSIGHHLISISAVSP